MPSGKTFDMLALTRQFRWRVTSEREARPRDRSLRGKDRIRARKASKPGSVAEARRSKHEARRRKHEALVADPSSATSESSRRHFEAKGTK